MVLSLFPVPSSTRPPSASASLRTGQAPPPSSTLSIALRNNPFGLPARSRTTSAPSAPGPDDPAQEQAELNHALEALARMFPDVKVEVFRDLLVRFDGQSRLQVCVEQLLRHKEEWVAGRWNVPAGSGDVAGSPDEHAVPPDERFRDGVYKVAVRAALTKEFGSLSRSAVDAVLAEANFCYGRARPTLQDLSRKTWRATIHSILPSFRRKRDRDEHPLLAWQRHENGELVPRLKETGCAELDQELHDAVLAPLLGTQREAREAQDWQLAGELNEVEAREADALYECECCLADVTFEQLGACSDHTHIICYGCIQRTLHEALFGQGWSKSVDPERSTLKCLAPTTRDSCAGSLNADVVKRAVLMGKGGIEAYCKFETRLASDALLQSQLKLIHCPFCPYAEVDPAYHPHAHGIRWRFRREGFLSTTAMIIFLLDLIPLLIIPAIILYILDPSAASTIFRNSLLNLCLQVRPKRFRCRNPACQRVSCVTCQKSWRDPHVCHEPLLLDLRATVEAARTAAVKRTCPRCGLSFVKSSGCNKLTCLCGYSMCYLCRRALGPPLNPPQRRRPRRRPRRPHNENIDPHNPYNPNEDPPSSSENDEQDDPPEGYSHYCEHFRINPGARCLECTKCELYQEEDEEAVARRAGERAEREWRLRQGMAGVGVGSTLHVNRDFSARHDDGRASRGPLARGKDWMYWVDEVWRDGQWKMEGQAFVDWVVERVVVVEV